MCVVPTTAQTINIRIYEKSGDDGTRVLMTGMEVWTFISKAEANNAKKKFENGNNIDATDGVRDHGKSDGQTMQLRGSASGYLLLDNGIDFTEVISCKEHMKELPEGTFIEYTFVKKKTSSKFGDQNNGIDMAELVTLGKRPVVIDDDGGEVIACGKTLSYEKTMHLNKFQTRSDARYVVYPLLVELGTDSAYQLNPAVLDGEDYHATMHRRMGYEADVRNNPIHDNMGPYIFPLHYMKERTEDSLRVSGTFYGYDENKKYIIMGHVWMEDYNAVYYKDKVIIWDGKPRHPERYLDWKSSVPESEIVHERYARRELTTESKFADTLHLQFEVGKPKLNMNDSMTVAELDKIIERLSRIASNENSELRSVTIRSYSSPEGSFNGNRDLSHGRGAEVKKILNSGVRGNKPPMVDVYDDYDNIATWDRVAEELEKMNTEEAKTYAAEVREIIERTSNISSKSDKMKAQYDAISSNKTRYDFIHENILPKLRVAFIEYSSVEQRIIPQDETYQRYKQKEDGYWDGTILMPYQIYHLMNHLYNDGDWEGLERISKAAMESSNEELKETARKTYTDRTKPRIAESDSTLALRKLRDERERERYANDQRHMVIEDSLFRIIHKGDTIGYEQKDGDDFKRPYSLAAFYWTKCLLNRGEVNTSLLENYIDVSNRGLEHQKRVDGNLREWWNDEALVLNQVMMYCADDDYEKAFKCANEHLPAGDPRFNNFRLMLRALNCEWKETEVLEAVASTSPMNACAAYIAQNRPEYYYMADSLLQDTTKFDMNDARVHYLRAICRFHTEEPTCENLNEKFYSSGNVYDPDAKKKNQKGTDWAAPMLEAFRLDPSNISYIETDGYFNDAYRGLVLYFWKRMQDGISMEQIAEEYDALKNEYLKNPDR